MGYTEEIEEKYPFADAENIGLEHEAKAAFEIIFIGGKVVFIIVMLSWGLLEFRR